MGYVKVLAVAGVVALGMTMPVLAKQKTDQGATEASVPGGEAETLYGPILADAIRLCDLLVDDKRAIVQRLEAEGWTHEIDYNVGNAPFYKELTGSFSYPGVGDAEIWGFIEEYPGYDMGYCSFKITQPEIRFSITSLNDLEGMVGETEENGEEVFGAWRDASDAPNTFIHAYHNSDTFSYQITRFNQLN